MTNVLTLETNRYNIKIENFEGPLDLLCHLVDKNKLSIYDINLSDITDQYIEYLNQAEELNLDITSEFLVMASALIYIKSKSLLPAEVEDEAELTEEELIRRIIEYKKYKEITKILKQNYEEFSMRFYKFPDDVKLPKQELEVQLDINTISDLYMEKLENYKNKINKNAINIQRIAITETVSVTKIVKDIFRELLRKPKFIFNKLFSIRKYKKLEVVTAFTGILELTRRNKVNVTQTELFGDIIVEKIKK